MNSVLQLTGRFESRKANPPNGPSYPVGLHIQAEDLVPLCDQLKELQAFWRGQPDIGGVLINVYYKRIVAKSNRILSLLTDGRNRPSQTICGAKFDSEGRKHIFTHYVSDDSLGKTAAELQHVMEIVKRQFNGTITTASVEMIRSGEIRIEGMSKTRFLEILHDVAYVERFGLDSYNEIIEQDAIVSLYKTRMETKSLLSQYGITIFDDRILNQTTVKLTAEEFRRLKQRAPYLIAMGLTDFRDLSADDTESVDVDEEQGSSIIPSPHNEPVVGVIDTHFDTTVYFHEWVEYSNELDDNIPLEPIDFRHGTGVSSIIVDGPRGNPKLDDGCGRFRVRHFGVAKNRGFSSFAILRMIRDIVSRNTDIKVWNLSLGSALQINQNFISPEAAELDLIQSEYDVLFVVAGTNVPDGVKDTNMRLGAPADSLNSIVVNSVDFNNRPASYTRVGPVLSFFNKPDVCYYGGDGRTVEERIAVCDGIGASYVKGTSYAAPWIARKAAYLIHIMGLSREITKALLIDSASQWNRGVDMPRKGYGIVPTHIDKIVNSESDEIRFVVYGTMEEYETHNYNLPVPVVQNAYPFLARATLVYFPHCNRNQGVDYSGAELDISFGRVEIKKSGSPGIRTINNNWQTEEGYYTTELDARELYRKWDNVKHIGETINSRARPRKMLDSEFWGISIKSKSRENNGRRDSLPFGIVITLKEMNGVNRFEDFISLCQVRGWLVERLDVRTRLDIYAKAEEEVHFE